MTIKELEAKVLEIKELERMSEELAAEIDAAKDEIKSVMDAENIDSMTVGAFKISWKMVTSCRFDTTAFKKALPEVAARFMKESSARRFVIS